MQGRLRFVIDNWWLGAIPEHERKSIKYIVAAMLHEEEDEDIQILEKIRQDFN